MITFMNELFTNFGDLLKTVLPKSPFANVVASLSGAEWLGWLNWVFPVGRCLDVLALWLVAYGLYLVYSIILRWIGAID